MDLTIPKRVLYGLCAAMCLSLAILTIGSGVFLLTLGILIEESTSAVWSMANSTASFAVPGIILLLVTIRYSSLLAAPVKGKYVFLLSVLAIIWPLTMDLLNPKQQFHAGHVLFMATFIALIYDAVILHRRAKRLSNINWK